MSLRSLRIVHEGTSNPSSHAYPRRQLSSIPLISESNEVDAPASHMLLTSLCSAWEDMGRRTRDVLDKVQRGT